MAKGSFRVFNTSINNIGKKGFDLSASADYKLMLITTLPVVTETTQLTTQPSMLIITS